jgi:hypothetical protein
VVRGRLMDTSVPSGPNGSSSSSSSSSSKTTIVDLYLQANGKDEMIAWMRAIHAKVIQEMLKVQTAMSVQQVPMHAHAHRYMHTHTHTRTRTHARTHARTHTHPRTHVRIHTHAHTYTQDITSSPLPFSSVSTLVQSCNQHGQDLSLEQTPRSMHSGR